MNNQNLIIKEAVLAKSTGVRDSNYEINNGKMNQKIHLEFEVYSVPMCVIDEDNQRVISIEDKTIYPIIQRDDQGKIIPTKNIQFDGEIVALMLLEPKFEKMSYEEKRELNNKAKEVYKQYLEQQPKGLSLIKKKRK